MDAPLLTKLSSTFTKLGMCKQAQTVTKVGNSILFQSGVKIQVCIAKPFTGGFGGWPHKKKKRTAKGGESETELDLPRTIVSGS